MQKQRNKETNEKKQQKTKTKKKQRKKKQWKKSRREERKKERIRMYWKEGRRACQFSGNSTSRWTPQGIYHLAMKYERVVSWLKTLTTTELWKSFCPESFAGWRWRMKTAYFVNFYMGSIMSSIQIYCI